jgi:hypothetical protein
MAIYEAETLAEIREYQNRKHGKLIPAAADEDGVYPDGDHESEWWKTRIVFNPSQLPTTIDDVPKYCFLSDRVIAWIGTTQLKNVTGDQRHKYWPADFANGGEMNTSRARRDHVGLPALTADGSVVSWRDTYLLSGTLPLPGAGDDWRWKVVESRPAKDHRPQPKVIIDTRDADDNRAWYSALAKKVIKETKKVNRDTRKVDKDTKKVDKDTKKISSSPLGTEEKQTGGQGGKQSPVIKTEAHTTPLSISKYGAVIPLSSDEDVAALPTPTKKRPTAMPQAIKDLKAQVDLLEDQVQHLQEARSELLGERNFATQLANDFHASRLRLVAMGNSLLTTADPGMKKFKEAFKKEADIINGQITALDDKPILQSVLFGNEQNFTTPPVWRRDLTFEPPVEPSDEDEQSDISPIRRSKRISTTQPKTEKPNAKKAKLSSQTSVAEETEDTPLPATELEES